MGAPGTPLATALGTKGALTAWYRVLPPNCPTNFTRVAGLNRQTAIDHVFLRGDVTQADHEVVPTASSHAGIFMTVTRAAGRADPYAWKLFRWRAATEEQREQFRAALALMWGWLAVAPTPAADYIGCLHFLASQYIPLPISLPAVLRRLCCHPPPWATTALHSFIAEASTVAPDRRSARRMAGLSATSVTSATPASMCLPSARLENSQLYRVHDDAVDPLLRLPQHCIFTCQDASRSSAEGPRWHVVQRRRQRPRSVHLRGQGLHSQEGLPGPS